MAGDTRVAIVGSGVAGLACARRLALAGFRPILFDKGRDPGGRLATRRTDTGLQFDHGAQYLTGHDAGFVAVLDAAAAAGAAGRWAGTSDRPRYVGTPAMNGLAAHLAAGLELRQSQTVSAVRRDGQDWLVCVGDAGLRFPRVVLTVPAPQIARLVGPEHPFVAAVRHVEMAPCLTLMAALAEDTPAPFVSRSDDDDPLAWIALDSSKPGRPGGRAWVAQAGSAWSTLHLELPAAGIVAMLLPLLCARLGAAPASVRHAVAHRWRHARVTRPLGTPFLRDVTGSLHAGGDWCLAARVEAAWQSGDAIARDIVATA